jgi:hypothetical protein
MEDILILILQALGEFLLELLAWAPWDWFWYWGPSTWEPRGRSNPYWAAAITSLSMGALLGWGSVYVFPAVLVKWSWLRVVLLFVSPPTSGYIAREMARWRQERDASIDLGIHFLIGLCFSIGFVWVRFALAHRPG